MKNPISLVFLLLFALLAFSATASAQDGPPPEGDRMPPPRDMQGPPRDMQQGPPRQEDDRGELLRQLNLSQDQFKTIRKLLGDNGPQVRAAQRDFREAQEALDEAIYADTVDEVLVQSLTKRSSDAQAALMKLRAVNEFAIRRVLTPDQVTKFRELRKQQMLKREEERRQMRMNGNGPGGPNGPDGRNGPPPNRRPLGQPGGMGQPGGQQPPPGEPVNNAAPNQQRKPI
jgi:Spy/CpxP family protein refolding chaperone